MTNRTVEQFLHSWYSNQLKLNFVLYKTIESFFFEFNFSFRVIHFFQKKSFLSKNFKVQTGYFFRFQELKKKLSIGLLIKKFRFFWYQDQSCRSKTVTVRFFRIAKFRLFRRATFLWTSLKYWWTVVAFNPLKPHLYTSHSWKIPQQHPLYVDNSLEAFFF